ncbi:putative ATPase [Acidovorax soli]|uniref:Putative ATPase n=1 Tax=Acidovorax soli TaxID=592050 RepID=A0A7X0U900_9BURK|nr:AAA family ATPase [Acidovorax soli]MBB6559005.1 putative ATPase [Acidovorax soli]
MIEEIKIENYKSIEEIKIPLGLVNVFIGENGAGKSNILEVIALAGAAAAEKLDNEFLSSRGIRVTNPEGMRPGFNGCDINAPIKITVKNNKKDTAKFELNNDNLPYSKWTCTQSSNESFDLQYQEFESLLKDFQELASSKSTEDNKQKTEAIGDFFLAFAKHLESVDSKKFRETGKIHFNYEIADEKKGKIITNRIFKNSSFAQYLGNFVVYSPENSALRMLQKEGQIEPLGINGEGVFRLLSVIEKNNPEQFEKIKSSLRLLGWFEDFRLKEDSGNGTLEVKDRYLSDSSKYLDSISTNEGFLFLLFYFLLFSSHLTPSFFAVDNIDASLNPKLCEKLMRELVKIAKTTKKQAIFTTHNPSILDGINLDDDNQRLFVVSRGRTGKTKIQRILKPAYENHPRRLSELFINGVLGGLPKAF